MPIFFKIDSILLKSTLMWCCLYCLGGSLSFYSVYENRNWNYLNDSWSGSRRYNRAVLSCCTCSTIYLTFCMRCSISLLTAAQVILKCDHSNWNHRKYELPRSETCSKNIRNSIFFFQLGPWGEEIKKLKQFSCIIFKHLRAQYNSPRLCWWVSDPQGNVVLIWNIKTTKKKHQTWWLRNNAKDRNSKSDSIFWFLCKF